MFFTSSAAALEKKRRLVPPQIIPALVLVSLSFLFMAYEYVFPTLLRIRELRQHTALEPTIRAAAFPSYGSRKKANLGRAS
jgi:hypothetical protein